MCERFTSLATEDRREALAVAAGRLRRPVHLLENALAALAGDYERMIGDGLLLDDAEPFDDLITRCASIEALANVRRDRPA